MSSAGSHETVVISGISAGNTIRKRFIKEGATQGTFMMPETDNEDVKGINQYNRRDGEHMAVVVIGAYEVEFAAPCAYGQRVFSDANGRAVPVESSPYGATTFNSPGWSMSTVLNAGDVGVVMLDFAEIER